MEHKKISTRYSSQSHLAEDFISELLSPDIEPSVTKENTKETISEFDTEVTITMQDMNNEDMQLHLTESDVDEERDDSFAGSPLVRKLSQSVEREKKSSGKIFKEKTLEDGIQSENFGDFYEKDDLIKNMNALPDTMSWSVTLCESRPTSEDEQKWRSDNAVNDKVVMSRKDFSAVTKKWPENVSCSVKVCDKRSPCKGTELVIIKENDGIIKSQNVDSNLDFTSSRRKSSYETPVVSRTWSATYRTTPDLFDTSSATEEYSMNLSNLSAYADERKRKFSECGSKLFTDDEKLSDVEKSDIKRDIWRNNYDNDLSNDAEGDDDNLAAFGAGRKDDGRNQNNSNICGKAYCDFETDDKTVSGYTLGKHRNRSGDEDDVMVLSKDEIEKLPKCRSPSPVFISQTHQNATSEANELYDGSVIKEEKEMVEKDNKEKKENRQSEINREDEKPNADDPVWVCGHTPLSRKTKKTYISESKKCDSSKGKDVHSIEFALRDNTSYSGIDESSPVVAGRVSVSLAHGQKRKKNISDSSVSCSSFNIKKRPRVTGSV